MSKKTKTLAGQAVAGPLLCGAFPLTAGEPLERAFAVLRSYDWGHDRGALNPIDDAARASHGDAAARKALEGRLAALLKTDAPPAAKFFACRKLSRIGSAASVPALSALLTDENLSHMSRHALERLPCAEAAAALRDALPRVKGKIKVGVINSLGVRRDVASASRLLVLLGDPDAEVAGAAAAALGRIGTSEAAGALRSFQEKAPRKLKRVAADACLVCAQGLLAAGKKREAVEIYEPLRSASQPAHVRLAAERGLSAAARGK